MSHQEHQVAGIISEDVNDERRLYECARKYETIVKQFDELVEIMNNGTAVPKKWRKSRRGSASGGRAAVSSSQPNNNEALVQTVTRFLHELRIKPTDSDCSSST
ncbi:hypothetical protein E2542_SST24447 [Spatholobus suberectus]|nr:hypothetical protein E2542_SST24447 [Spatholobus suberectus]